MIATVRRVINKIITDYHNLVFLVTRTDAKKATMLHQVWSHDGSEALLSEVGSCFHPTDPSEI